MKDFRIRILGLAAVASLFAGVSYGQTASCQFQTSGPVAPFEYVTVFASISTATQTIGPAGPGAFAIPNPASPLLDRAEGTTELVSDLVLTQCTSTSQAASAQVVAFLSQPVTSKVINTGVTTANTEATLIVTPSAAGTGVPTGASVLYAGTVNGTTVTFTGVSFPANFNLEVADIRVNASGTGATVSPVAITESLFAGFNGQSTISVSALTVGQALQSLVTPAFTLGNFNLPDVSNHVICVGNAVSVTGAPFSTNSWSFVINIAETLGGFFKSGPAATVLSTTVPNSEYGTFVGTNPAGSTAGVPTHGTRVQLVIAGVPASATVYVPISLTNAGATITLTSSASGGFSAVSASTTTGVPANLWGALTPSSGTVTAVYEVTTASPASIQTFSVPVYVTFAANSTTSTQVTVLESYAPNGSTDIPNFAASAATPLNASAITACVTNLLFPFVTSQLGFDTGLAISNTSADPFGKYGAVPSGTTAPSGACILSFYGTGAPTPATVTTPSIASGAVYALVNSSVAPGFQGYIIAQCPFVAGHGYAFVTNTSSAGNAGVAQGYTALALPAANSSGTKRIFPTAGNTESLGQ